MYYSQNGMGIAPTRQAIKDYVSLALNADVYNIEVVDDFDTLRTRHICRGTNVIQLLDETVIPVPTTKGIINVQVFFCYQCRKLIINRSSMEVY